jgi:hypothetical protein
VGNWTNWLLVIIGVLSVIPELALVGGSETIGLISAAVLALSSDLKSGSTW